MILDKMPLVSVVITTFNRKDKVGNAIQAVLDQTYKNVEIIVVDDCSTDGTIEYFEENWNSEVKYVRHEENKGVQYASNTGYSYTSGKYLAFIGDDDIWSDPEKLQTQVDVFEKDTDKNYGIVTTSVHMIQDDNEFDKIIKKPKNLLKHILGQNGIIYGTAALLRRDAFEFAGRFSEELPKGTDSDVYRRIIIQGYDAYFIKKPMINYYEIGHDRMTLPTERGLSRSIKGINYQFQNYSHYFDLYRGVKSKRYQQLGNVYHQLYKIRSSKINLETARKAYLKSFLTNPFNYVSFVKFIRSFFE